MPRALEDESEEGWPWKTSTCPSRWLGMRPRHLLSPTDISGKFSGRSSKEPHRMGGPARDGAGGTAALEGGREDPALALLEGPGSDCCTRQEGRCWGGRRDVPAPCCCADDGVTGSSSPRCSRADTGWGPSLQPHSGNPGCWRWSRAWSPSGGWPGLKMPPWPLQELSLAPGGASLPLLSLKGAWDPTEASPWPASPTPLRWG